MQKAIIKKFVAFRVVSTELLFGAFRMNSRLCVRFSCLSNTCRCGHGSQLGKWIFRLLNFSGGCSHKRTRCAPMHRVPQTHLISAASVGCNLLMCLWSNFLFGRAIYFLSGDFQWSVYGFANNYGGWIEARDDVLFADFHERPNELAIMMSYETIVYLIALSLHLLINLTLNIFGQFWFAEGL